MIDIGADTNGQAAKSVNFYWVNKNTDRYLTAEKPKLWIYSSRGNAKDLPTSEQQRLHDEFDQYDATHRFCIRRTRTMRNVPVLRQTNDVLLQCQSTGAALQLR